MPRLFVAIDLPDDRSLQLRDLHDDALSARWTSPEQYHLTLRFLGDAEASQADALRERLGEIDLPSFLLGGEGVGVFPSIRKPRVLVARISEDPGLMALQVQVDDLASELDFKEDRKSFNPHVTVARFSRTSPQQVRGYLKNHGEFRIEPFVVNEFRLYESELSPEGAIHRVIQSYPLRTAHGA